MPGSASPAAIPCARVETTRAPSLIGRRKVPVHVSPCQSERTRSPNSGCADTAIRRTGLRASENQTRLPKNRPSSNTVLIFAPGRFPDQGIRGAGARKRVTVHPASNPRLRQHHVDVCDVGDCDGNEPDNYDQQPAPALCRGTICPSPGRQTSLSTTPWWNGRSPSPAWMPQAKWPACRSSRHAPIGHGRNRNRRSGVGTRVLGLARLLVAILDYRSRSARGFRLDHE